MDESVQRLIDDIRTKANACTDVFSNTCGANRYYVLDVCRAHSQTVMESSVYCIDEDTFYHVQYADPHHVMKSGVIVNAGDIMNLSCKLDEILK